MSLLLLFPYPSGAVGDQDTYMELSALNPDVQDWYVEGTHIQRWAETLITLKLDVLADENLTVTKDITVAAGTITISNTGSFGLIQGVNGTIEWGSTNLTGTGILTFGRAIISGGVTSNEAGGGGAGDDFRAETVSNSNAFVVDASADEILAKVATKIGDGTNQSQFDTDGSLVFAGTAGLPYAEIYASDASDTITIAVTGKANKVQITSFTVDGVSNNMTPDHTNDHITVTKAGIYLCTVSMHAVSVGGGGADNYGYSVYKNNGATEFSNLHGQRDLAGGGGDEGSMTLSGLIDLAVNDTIEVWIWNNTNDDDIVIDDINLALIQCGGT